ncbi:MULTISPECIES: ABC transporter substrate-binding protein [unclassified Streptomyces]|uniref:ABC transporter substrate-binding protein n=1 Tax=unclassified Streptomyces TaxID=2593676 RepID=UPI00224D8D06|nr:MULTISPECIES: extracellular solute-binding protein [unclassified Streptomyces]MCX4992940.1 extracellular solute-binding protein [Streptomyces sp. NBC_00568]MCX5001824.1 extracellular solute-binding protein [Streptomyces sp. NBC_00638]
MSLRTFRARRTRLGLFTAGAASMALLATACGGSGSGTAAAPKNFSYLSVTENTTVKTALTSLSEGSCKSANDALPLKVETVPQASLDQKLQLLAGQGALPVQFAAGNAPALTQKLAKSGKIADLEAKLKELGVDDQLEPAAVSTIKALYGGKLEVLPYEYNIEGVFYNKKIFEANGLKVPGTWDELVASAAKLQAKGIQPFSASGQQGWPLTRLLSGYLYRSLGPDALKDVADGKAKLTDPQYVKAAAEIAALGKKGYFGKGVGSIDYDTAMNQFLTGKAAMLYMGSWALANISDAKQDKIGADNVGFMPFPAVSGGKGSIDQYPSNVGLGITLGAKSFDKNTGAWVSCIAKNYGSKALKDHGSISGFKVNTPVTDANEVTTQVRETISASKQNVLWFEALFGTKATTISQTNAAGLVSGSVSPEQFMQTVQDALSAQ